MNNEFRHIGKESHRLLGEQIVTGRAKYTGDFKLPGMQYGKILRSPHPFARIISIDVEAAKKLPGVTAVVTWKDVDRNIYITNGFTPPKHYHIMDEYVRYIGDAVALVVAVTEDIAMEALELIKVEYEVLKPVFTIDEALAPDAPQLYPEFPGNIAPHKNNLNFEVGDIEKGFAESDVVVEVDAAMDNGQNPLPVEAPIIIASWEGETVTLIASAAAPAYCHQNVASSLDIPYECVRLIAPAVGGSFGSKLYSGNVQVLVYAAIMAKAARCPVLYGYTKEEHFAAHQNRMSTKAHIKFGMKKDGLASAIEMRQYADAGCCASTQEFMLAVGTNTLPILCKTDNKKFDADVVVTNHIPSGSFRGYGYMESTALLTQAIFEACEKLDIDPVTYFEKNAMKLGERYHNAMAGPHFWQNNMAADWSNLVTETAKAFHWSERWKGWGVPTWVSADGKRARGVGVAAAGHSDTGGKPSNANVTITGLGAVYVSTCMAEFGAGTRDIQLKVAAETLNVPLDAVRLSPSDTGVTPPDFGSTGSRSTYCGGIAVKRACEDALDKIFTLAEEKIGIPKDDCGFRDGYVYRLSNPEEKYTLFPRLMGKVDSVTGCGHFDGVHNSTIYHLQFVEVEVDKEMGTFKIIDHFGGSDAGVIVNPLPLRNQVQSFFAGVDIACMEETVWDPNDYRVLNPSNIDYKVRTFNDVVPHDHIILESNKGRDTEYPFGAFGVGEPLLAPGGPAIRLAIYNACGIKLNSYPFTPAKILAALKEKEGK
ncbi:xanthine dehydrogenase family protein molybdopterin-binding subunit [Angelakisella massiliensis]|uniref:xanthine dehydrogenase family protein molybdopterin-binding subunit n=1 Tax=Angelakisella massiliensis TaxID=1871018 RepID=UPI0023A83807|nr:xanthine dehydrogenase family protein molybdopterin-binding subunit [Angelakisella massiliensis]